jgi:surfactin synthase thioesterase subunit
MAATETYNRTWLRRFHPTPDSSIQLVLLPHAGGSASFYFPVSQRLSNKFDVLAVQYPGRQDRRQEPLIDDLHTLAEAVFDALHPLAERPIALFGHSMGATLAFEVARRLEERAGSVLTRLFASGRRAPSRARDERVHLLDDQGLLADVRRLSGTDSRVLDDEEVLRMSLPAIRSDYKAAETYRYRPGPPLHCPITVFTGDDDPKTTIDEARSWSEHTSGRFDIEVFPGGHFFLIQHQGAVLDAIGDTLRSTP